MDKYRKKLCDLGSCNKSSVWPHIDTEYWYKYTIIVAYI